MKSLTYISSMLLGNNIEVPKYQRAYSWDTDRKTKKPRQVNIFLSNLQDYVNTNSYTPYYFGHFLFEEKGDNNYAIIDGQERLTTTVIFLSTLHNRLKKVRNIYYKLEDFDKRLCHINTLTLYYYEK